MATVLGQLRPGPSVLDSIFRGMEKGMSLGTQAADRAQKKKQHEDKMKILKMQVDNEISQRKARLALDTAKYEQIKSAAERGLVDVAIGDLMDKYKMADPGEEKELKQAYQQTVQAFPGQQAYIDRRMGTTRGPLGGAQLSPGLFQKAPEPPGLLKGTPGTAWLDPTTKRVVAEVPKDTEETYTLAGTRYAYDRKTKKSRVIQEGPPSLSTSIVKVSEGNYMSVTTNLATGEVVERKKLDLPENVGKAIAKTSAKIEVPKQINQILGRMLQNLGTSQEKDFLLALRAVAQRGYSKPGDIAKPMDMLSAGKGQRMPKTKVEEAVAIYRKLYDAAVQEYRKASSTNDALYRLYKGLPKTDVIDLDF